MQRKTHHLPNRKVFSSKRGFTLIELVVAMAIFLTILAITFSAITNFYRLRVVYDQEIVLQQNFRFAIDKMSEELREASKDPNNTTDSIIVEPQDNAIGDELKFTKYYDSTNPYTNDIRYKLEGSNATGYALYRAEYPHNSAPANDQPVTENMKQLVKAYFVHSGGEVVVILIGKINYFGKENTISYTTLIFSRNSPY